MKVELSEEMCARLSVLLDQDRGNSVRCLNDAVENAKRYPSEPKFAEAVKFWEPHVIADTRRLEEFKAAVARGYAVRRRQRRA